MTTQPSVPRSAVGARSSTGVDRTVGDYEVMSRIGEGGMGVVHLARKPGGTRVALKMLRPHIVGDDEARARLAREVKSLSRVRSQWVAEIVDADPWAEIPYVATRYVPGLSLHDHVREEGPVDGQDLLWFAACLAEGLASVHAVGVLHRDIKPSNVLMEGRTPILIDFGLARVADDPKLTHTGWLLGTPGYLAPEILYGDDATAASDVHSWAATVAFAATGNPPFGRGPSMAIMDRVRRGEHNLTGLDGTIRDVVAAALHPEPTRRPTLEAILGWLRPQTTRPQPVLAPPPVPVEPGEDMFTIPLALAAQAISEAETEHVPDQAPDRAPSPVTLPMLADSQRSSPASMGPTRVEQEWERPWDGPLAPPPGPVRVSAVERVRRALLLSAAATTVGAACAAAPWIAGVLVLLSVWVLRSGSLAASATGDRRRLRGPKWYDGAQFLLGAPWHLVRSIPGTVILVLWSAGLAVAAALVCYALAVGLALTLFASGVVLALSLWWGPGGTRLRSPLSRVVHPLSASVGRWVLALTVVLVVGVALGVRVAGSGVSWSPDDQRPLSSYPR
ncbi:MAG: serine/threonine-protein kinase [Nocardioides sp.]